MATVWDAMKKFEAEQAERAQQEGGAPAQDAPAQDAPAPRDKPVPALKGEPAGAGLIPGGKYSELLIVHNDRGGAITEEYRAVRTSLLAQCSEGRFCYLVTSANAKEGKTVTCVNLGLAMTECVDHKTVMIDCDLRKGGMAALLGAETGPGMADLLRGSAALSDCVQATSYPNLFFIPAATANQAEAGELLGRPELNEIVSELRHRYDYVIFDTPPINIASDAGIVGRAVTEALLVVRMNKTRRESVEKAIRLLHAANVELSGIIMTHRKYYIPSYLYRYS